MSASSNLIRNMDGHLRMLRSSRADSWRLADFYSRIFTKTDGSPSGEFFPFVEDLLNGRHPTFHEDDFIYVEDEESGKIVSAMNLISQVWTYGGIPIPCGRPEDVATDPAYRNRGLVRAMFEQVHNWSSQRSELLQGITGIPFYYRLYGYEMCVQLEGGWRGTSDSLPKVKQSQQEAYQIRPVMPEDIPFLTDLYQKSCERLLMACPRPAETWQMNLFTRSTDTEDYEIAKVIESPAHEPLGFFVHHSSLGPDYIDENMLGCSWYALKKGVSYLDVTPVVLDHLLKTGQKYASDKGKTCSGVGMILDNGHPANEILGEFLPRKVRDYAWYMRVPDLPAFLTKVAPVLEQRLEDSCCSGHTGDLAISFYQSKLNLSFSRGKLTKAEQKPFTGDADSQACFPGLTFYHLLFGYRTVSEIRNLFADCLVDADVKPVLDALFPRCPSNIWAL